MAAASARSSRCSSPPNPVRNCAATSLTYIGDRAGEYYGAVREKAGDWYGSAREGVSRKTGQFSAAVEAGKQAYNEEKRRTELSGASEAQPTYPPQGDLS